MKTRTGVMVVAAVTATGIAAFVARTVAWHVVPTGWTGEPERLAALLEVKPGHDVAEIGAGNGALAVRVATIIGRSGRLFATELSETKRREIGSLVASMAIGNVQVVAAGPDRTNLPDRCCDALYMRMVFHHISDPVAYAREVARAVRPGGRVAIIDFAPGALFFLGPQHGVAPETVIAAFEGAGLSLVHRIKRWGGGNYMLLFTSSSRESWMRNSER